MMEKMGWSQGQGLGKGDHGTQQFVRAKQKKDNGGIGSEKGGQDSSWVATQGLFNDLLKRLNEAQAEGSRNNLCSAIANCYLHFFCVCRT